jgi:hypothetical protein
MTSIRAFMWKELKSRRPQSVGRNMLFWHQRAEAGNVDFLLMQLQIRQLEDQAEQIMGQVEWGRKRRASRRLEIIEIPR